MNYIQPQGQNPPPPPPQGNILGARLIRCKQSTCLKKPGWMSCTVIPHCRSSQRKTSASAVAACLVMQ
jgi:hypothetical protein